MKVAIIVQRRPIVKSLEWRKSRVANKRWKCFSTRDHPTSGYTRSKGVSNRSSALTEIVITWKELAKTTKNLMSWASIGSNSPSALFKVRWHKTAYASEAIQQSRTIRGQRDALGSRWSSWRWTTPLRWTLIRAPGSSAWHLYPKYLVKSPLSSKSTNRKPTACRPYLAFIYHRKSTITAILSWADMISSMRRLTLDPRIFFGPICIVIITTGSPAWAASNSRRRKRRTRKRIPCHFN